MVGQFHYPTVHDNITNHNSEVASVVRDYNSLPLLLLQLITVISIVLRMADLPDLSHLTAEERRIIENVMLRQKQEEEREHEIMR